MVAWPSEIAEKADVHPGIAKFERIFIEFGYGIAQIEPSDLGQECVSQAQAQNLGVRGRDAVLRIGKIGYGVKIARIPWSVAVFEVENAVQRGKDALFVYTSQVMDPAEAEKLIGEVHV